MTDDESAEASAQAKKNEAIFLFLIGIVPEDGAIVVEDGFGLLKGNAMLPFVGRVCWTRSCARPIRTADQT